MAPRELGGRAWVWNVGSPLPGFIRRAAASQRVGGEEWWQGRLGGWRFGLLVLPLSAQYPAQLNV